MQQAFIRDQFPRHLQLMEPHSFHQKNLSFNYADILKLFGTFALTKMLWLGVGTIQSLHQTKQLVLICPVC